MSIKKLKQYDDLYEIGLSPISDLVYDNLKDELKKKYPDDPYFNTVGSNIDSREKVKLPFVLGSLKKLKADGTTNKWLSTIEPSETIVIGPKLDGVSICVEFFKGKVNKAFLRGDGVFGREITNKCKKFIKPIKETTSQWFRGEVLLDHIPEGYTNKRNAVAGILNDDKSNENLNLLKVIFYEHINSQCDLETDRFKLMNFFKIPIIECSTMTVKDINEDVLTEVLKKYKVMYADFGIDGLVLTVNNSDRENVKHPEKKKAFKVNQEAVETVVKKVWNNTGRTGRVIPLVEIEPITIDGSTISKVTGHNIKMMIDRGIAEGVKITVVKSGDVIPYIVDVIDPGEFTAPDVCDTCGTGLKWKGVDLVCPSDNCEAQTLKRIEYFIKKIGVMGISLSTIEKLPVQTINDLYELKVEDIMTLDGFGPKKAEHIVTELKDKLIMSPAKFLASMGISGFGEETATKLLEVIDIDDFLASNNKRRDYTIVDGIGGTISENINDGMERIFHHYVLLSAKGLKWEKKAEDNELSGKIFCLTGTAPLKRDDLVRILESNGCRVKNMSKKVDFLVTNDLQSNSSKAKKARNYGIPFMSYDKLLEKLGVVE